MNCSPNAAFVDVARRRNPASATQLDAAVNRIFRPAADRGMPAVLAPQLGRPHANDAVVGHRVCRGARMGRFSSVAPAQPWGECARTADAKSTADHLRGVRKVVPTVAVVAGIVLGYASVAGAAIETGRDEWRRLAITDAGFVRQGVVIRDEAGRCTAADASHASAAIHSLTDNRIESPGTAELRRKHGSHASSGRMAPDAVDRGVEPARVGSSASPRLRLEQPLLVSYQPTGSDDLADGGWNFEDDAEPAETWQQLVKDQATDLAMFTAFAALALTSFFRKSVPLKYVTLVAAVAYLGVYKSQLLSIVNVFGAMGGNLPLFRYNLGWYLFAVFSVASTVLWGRFYCGRVCAYGALTQLLDPIVPARYRYDMPLRIERHANRIKYALLAGVIFYFLVTSDMSIYRYVEPFWLFGGQASTGLWIALGVLLVATVFIRNLYCRFLCPLGAALGLLSKVAIFGIKRWSECNTCKICERTCQWGAIDGPKIIMTECVRCDDCERLYMDQQKCPHWIIIRRRQDGVSNTS